MSFWMSLIRSLVGHCCCGGMEQEKETSVTLPHLPDYLVERILSMVPFPFIFKVQALSKSWLARFSPGLNQSQVWRRGPFSPMFAPTLLSEDENSPAPLFQKQVSEWSGPNWKTFCPVFFGREDFVAYDRASHRWLRMPWASCMPFDDLPKSAHCWHLQGALLLVCWGEGCIYLVNILTRVWTWLKGPSPQWPGEYIPFHKWLIPISSDSYKVVVFTYAPLADTGMCVVKDYCSNTCKWKETGLFVSRDYKESWKQSNWANLNGTLYKVVCPDDGEVARRLLAYNAKEGIFEALEMRLAQPSRSRDLFVACNGSLLMLTYDGEDYFVATSVIVQKIEVGTGGLSEVTRGPPAALGFDKFGKKPMSDGDSILFLGAGDHKAFVDGAQCKVLSYNMVEDNWSCFALPQCVLDYFDPVTEHIERCGPQAMSGVGKGIERAYDWVPCSFNPGLNPFAQVF